mmetsp:Transcript_16455/g.35572  ORF Transcript_16455/g.35572 Transcript_16455/m.35572 type:complete len:252 (-) Transcript_16455:7-762(-)
MTVVLSFAPTVTACDLSPDSTKPGASSRDTDSSSGCALKFCICREYVKAMPAVTCAGQMLLAVSRASATSTLGRGTTLVTRSSGRGACLCFGPLCSDSGLLHVSSSLPVLTGASVRRVGQMGSTKACTSPLLSCSGQPCSCCLMSTTGMRPDSRFATTFASISSTDPGCRVLRPTCSMTGWPMVMEVTPISVTTRRGGLSVCTPASAVSRHLESKGSSNTMAAVCSTGAGQSTRAVMVRRPGCLAWTQARV